MGRMKKLTDYQEEIHKCSKCGLCQSVCPVYQQTGNDCSVSRGKFIMLGGIIKGDLELNKNVNKYLDMCLKCNACKDYCPSGIDAREIFLTAKCQYFDENVQKNPKLKFVKFFHSKMVFTTTLKAVKLATSVYRFLKLDKIVPLAYPIFNKMGFLGKKIILANEFVSTNVVGQVCPTYAKNPSPLHPFTYGINNLKSRSGIPARQRKTKIIYFKGCVNEFINPRVKNVTEKVLKQMGVKILPTQFECCGVPFLSSGNVEQFKAQAVFNLAQIPDDFDYFLTDCASCQNAFVEYKKFIDDPILVEKLDRILEKSMNINEFLMKNVESFEFEKEISFTFHKPCHLEDMGFLQEFLKKAKNVEYIEMKEFDKCCGFSGEFAIKNPNLSAKISKKKATNALATNADYIVTSCPACVLGLTQGLIENGENSQQKTVLNFVEFINMAKIR